MNTLALFDFDGTLYKKDSLLEFTKFSVGKRRFYTGLLLIAHSLIFMKLGLISNEKAKKKYITHFFKNVDYGKFKIICHEFSLKKIDQNVDQKIYAAFTNHIKSNHTVYIVTASLPEWIEPWSHQFGVSVIGTEIEVENNQITGDFCSKNCYGMEKVNRINTTLDTTKFDTIHVYGSGKGDKEMLTLNKKIISSI